MATKGSGAGPKGPAVKSRTGKTKASEAAGAKDRKGKGSEARPLSFLDIPDRMNEAWEWVCALCAFDFGDPVPLSELVRSGAKVPEEFGAAIADIIGGRRRPNRRAAAKLKIPAAERLKIAGSISLVLGLLDRFRIQPQAGQEEHMSGAVAIADRKGREPIDVVREMREEARTLILESAADLDVSVEAIEDLLRDLRLRIKNWPIV